MTTVKTKDVQGMSTEDLEAEASDLAEQRTAVRLRQNEVAAELSVRRALDALPVEHRRVLELRLEGGTEPKGEEG